MIQDPRSSAIENLLSHIALSLMKAARSGGILPAWKQLSGFLKEVRYPEYLGLLDAWMRCTSSLIGEEVRQEKVIEIFKENLNPEAGELAMSLAELIKEEGIAKGRAEGEAKGRLQTLQETLLKMINKGFGDDQELVKGVQATQDVVLLEDLIDTFLESPDRDILKTKLDSTLLI